MSFMSLQEELGISQSELYYELDQLRTEEEQEAYGLTIQPMEAVILALRLDSLTGRFAPKLIASYLQEEKEKSNLPQSMWASESNVTLGTLEEWGALKEENEWLKQEQFRLQEQYDQLLFKMIKPELEPTDQLLLGEEEPDHLLEVLEEEYYSLQEKTIALEKENRRLRSERIEETGES